MAGDRDAGTSGRRELPQRSALMMGQQRKKKEEGLILCCTHCQSYTHSAGVTKSSGERQRGEEYFGDNYVFVLSSLCVCVCVFVDV